MVLTEQSDATGLSWSQEFDLDLLLEVVARKDADDNYADHPDYQELYRWIDACDRSRTSGLPQEDCVAVQERGRGRNDVKFVSRRSRMLTASDCEMEQDWMQDDSEDDDSTEDYDEDDMEDDDVIE